jgi:hypothetical protein
LRGYLPENIYNAYNFFLSDATKQDRGEKYAGGKKNRGRLTALLCCNSTGTHVIVRRFAKPRCFKGISSPPASYVANGQAWIMKETFSNWLTETDKSMAKVKKKILLPDNCSAHKVDVRLENVKLEFLPASCMSLLRPMDQGILKNAKVHFRKRLVQQMIINIQKKLPTKITVLQGLQMITDG